jgi:hypothetical protein
MLKSIAILAAKGETLPELARMGDADTADVFTGAHKAWTSTCGSWSRTSADQAHRRERQVRIIFELNS